MYIYVCVNEYTLNTGYMYIYMNGCSVVCYVINRWDVYSHIYINIYRRERIWSYYLVLFYDSLVIVLSKWWLLFYQYILSMQSYVSNSYNNNQVDL